MDFSETIAGSDVKVYTNPTLRMKAGLFKNSTELSVTCERIGTSNWLIAIRMASTVAL